MVERSVLDLFSRELSTFKQVQFRNISYAVFFVARSNFEEDFLKRFSSFPMTLHVLAYILRFYARDFRTNGKGRKSISLGDRHSFAELKQ